jgi:abhydrolase domain-containing protein 14
MGRPFPLWIRGVLAFLALGTIRGWLPERVPAQARARARELADEHDPRRMCARELRLLPGVGHKLALVLAEARDTHAAEQPLAWEDVPGIGEVRSAAIRAWCRARGIAPDPLSPGSGRSAGRGYPVGVEELPFALRVAWLACLAACGDATRGAGPSPAAEHPAPAPDAALRTRTLALQGGALHALEAGRGGVLVLLLHGARFSAQTWEELGTLERLAGAGHHALAIDWPGFGATPAWGSEPDPSTLIGSVCDELGAERVVLVAPSMGGRFAFEFLESSAPRVAGLVAVAPAGADRFTPGDRCPPTLLLWGERDETVPLAQGRALAARLPGARLEVLPGASHPCYLDQPERFHALLLEFLGTITGASGR